MKARHSQFGWATARGKLLCMLPFLLLFYVQLVHHQLWRDEINAWGLVVASPDVHALLSNVHYEGHPVLWYVLLYPASKFTHAPWMLKLIESGIGTAIYLVFALASPLRRAEQLLVYCSSYILFEYTVMSRMYSLMLLFALLYLWSRVKSPERYVRNALLLGLVANADVTGMILSGGLLLEYLLDRFRQRASIASLLKAVSTYLGMVAVAAVTLWPAKDISWRTNGRMFAHARSLAHLKIAALNYLSVPWYPVHRYFPERFWDVHAEAHPSLYIALLPLTVLPVVWVFRRQPPLLVMMGSLALVGILFSHLIYIGSPRHFGIMFIGFLTGLWLLRAWGQQVSAAAYVLLGLSALSGAAHAYGQWARPFADDRAAAQWLRTNDLQNAALIGFPDTNVVGVPEMLGRPMYFLDCACVDTFLKFSRRRDDFDVDHGVPAALVLAVQRLHAPRMIYLSNRLLTPQETAQLLASGVAAEPLAQFTQGDIVDEHFFLYGVAASGSDPSGSSKTETIVDFGPIALAP